MELVKAIKGRILIRLKVGRWGAVREGFLEHTHLEDSAREGRMEREKSQKVRSRQRDYSVHRPVGKAREWLL